MISKHKSLIIALFVFISGIMSCKQPAKGPVWTKEYFDDAYKQAYEGASKAISDTSQRRRFAIYVVDHLRSSLPNGLSSVSQDSLKKLFIKFGSAYVEANNAVSLQMVLPWTQRAEKTLKASLMTADFLKNINESKKEQFCDCVIAKIKVLSPDSVRVPLSDSLLRIVSLDCKSKFEETQNR